jgi:hypothetical protein
MYRFSRIVLDLPLHRFVKVNGILVTLRFSSAEDELAPSILQGAFFWCSLLTLVGFVSQSGQMRRSRPSQMHRRRLKLPVRFL